MQIPHIGRDQRVLVICVKFSDLPNTRLSTAEKWVDLLNEQVRGFYNQATFSKTTFIFETVSGGPTDGWFQLPYRSDRPEGFYVQHLQDVITLADPYVDFRNYHRFLVITNVPRFFGQGTTFLRYTVRREEAEFWELENGNQVWKRYMSPAVIHEWERGLTAFDAAAFNVVHEMGHVVMCKEHYGLLTISGNQRDSITPWSVMGRSFPWSPPTHHLGWSKYERGWLVNDMENGSRILRGPPVTERGFNELVTLRPQEVLYPTGVQLILVPFSAEGPFTGYAIENRARLNGDEAIRERGVVISIIDENNQSPHEKAIVITNPRDPTNMDEVPFRENDSFRDEARNITIRVERRISSDDFQVRVQYPSPTNRRPNPIIRPWGAPPWETIDIWFDSQRNGWDTYRYGRDASGNVRANGDNPWLNHDNRIYARITNRGPGDASNVRVRLYSSQPPAIGNAPNSWTHIGNILFPLIRSQRDAADYIVWRPTTTAHTCVKAEIEGSPDFIDQSLKEAQENIAVFETTRTSPWKPVNVKAQVYNPYSKPITVTLNVADVPQDWGIQLDSSTLDLPPEGKADINLQIFPGGPPDSNDEISEKYKAGFIGKPKIEAWVPYEDTFILLGGIEAWVHLVDKSTINVDEVTVKDRSVVVNGSVSPDKEGLMTAIEIRQGKEANIFYATTDGKGRFIAEFKPPSTGLWTGQVFFDGNDTLASSESKEYEFEVSEA